MIENLGKLAVVRGGSFEGKDCRLTNAARKRMRALAQHLSEMGVMRPKILTSPVDCARESATILATEFNTGFEIQSCLEAEEYEANSPDGGRGKIEAIYQAVEEVCQRQDVKHLILVTHDFIVSEFPEHFIHRRWQRQERSVSIGRGQAWVINCEPALVDQPTQSILKRLIPEAV